MASGGCGKRRRSEACDRIADHTLICRSRRLGLQVGGGDLAMITRQKLDQRAFNSSNHKFGSIATCHLPRCRLRLKPAQCLQLAVLPRVPAAAHTTRQWWRVQPPKWRTATRCRQAACQRRRRRSSRRRTRRPGARAPAPRLPTARTRWAACAVRRAGKSAWWLGCRRRPAGREGAAAARHDVAVCRSDVSVTAVRAASTSQPPLLHDLPLHTPHSAFVSYLCGLQAA